MRWTSEIRDNKGEMCTAKVAIKRTCRLKVVVKDRRQRQTVLREMNGGIMIIKQSSNARKLGENVKA